MTENKKTYIIAGSILLLAYVVYRKRTYPTETNIINLLFGGILYPFVPPPPPPPPPPPVPPVDQPTEQQQALNMPSVKPVLQPSAPISASVVSKNNKATIGNSGFSKIANPVKPSIVASKMPNIVTSTPSFAQYSKKI